MSREERRAYQRQMKSMERGPALPAAAKARAERNAVRRARRQRTPDAPGAFTRGFVVRSALISLAAGVIGFSLQWPAMPFSAYVGLAVAVVVLGLLMGFRLLQRRVPPPAS